jgi:hypothetical protein
MTKTTGLTAPLSAAGSRTEPAQLITRRLAAAELATHHTRQQDRHELIILNIPGALSCLTLTGTGCARWHYEPAAGPATDPATLTAIIEHILGAPHAAEHTPGVDAYRAFPPKGAVGRYLQDRGLTVVLRVSEDLESFEATTDIEVTSPARPWLGTVRLSDNGHIEWDCDYRTAFHGNPSALIDVIAPILRAALTPARHIP